MVPQSPITKGIWINDFRYPTFKLSVRIRDFIKLTKIFKFNHEIVGNLKSEELLRAHGIVCAKYVSYWFPCTIPIELQEDVVEEIFNKERNYCQQVPATKIIGMF